MYYQTKNSSPSLSRHCLNFRFLNWSQCVINNIFLWNNHFRRCLIKRCWHICLCSLANLHRWTMREWDFTRVLVPQMICLKYKRNFPAYHFVKRKTSTNVRHRTFEHFTTTLQQGSTKTTIFHVFPWSITIISSVQVLIIGGGDGGVLREVVKHSCVEKAFRGFNWYGRRGVCPYELSGAGFSRIVPSHEVRKIRKMSWEKHPSSWATSLCCEVTWCEIDGDVVDAAKQFMPSVAKAVGQGVVGARWSLGPMYSEGWWTISDSGLT